MCKAVVCYIQIKFFQYNQKSLGHLSYLDDKLIKKFVRSLMSGQTNRSNETGIAAQYSSHY